MAFSFKKQRTLQSAPTRNDVILAYQLILRREPEDEGVVQYALKHYKSVQQLSEAFQNSPEFAGKMAPLVIESRFPLDHDPGGGTIEVHCDRESMSRLLSHVEQTWNQLGKEDPYWSVLSSDHFRGERFEANEELFWSTGQGEVQRLLRWLSRNRLATPRHGVCLEFGCGTGRITDWLSKEFDSVLGCDISAAHLALAQRRFANNNVKHVRFLCVDQLGELDSLPEFDLLFSVLVLQHNPPPVMAYILDKLLRRLRSGGIAYFQLPTYGRGYSFIVNDYVQRATQAEKEMEMHVLPQSYVFEIARRNGCEPVEVNPDNMAASLDYISTTFLLRKS